MLQVNLKLTVDFEEFLERLKIIFQRILQKSLTFQETSRRSSINLTKSVFTGLEEKYSKEQTITKKHAFDIQDDGISETQLKAEQTLLLMI